MSPKSVCTEPLAGALRTKGYSPRVDNDCVRIPADETPLKSLEHARLVREHGFQAAGYDEDAEHLIFVPRGEA